jgi:hypothetical protein
MRNPIQRAEGGDNPENILALIPVAPPGIRSRLIPLLIVSPRISRSHGAPSKDAAMSTGEQPEDEELETTEQPRDEGEDPQRFHSIDARFSGVFFLPFSLKSA